MYCKYVDIMHVYILFYNSVKTIFTASIEHYSLVPRPSPLHA